MIITPSVRIYANIHVGGKNEEVQSCLSLCFKVTCLAKTHWRNLT